MSPESSQYRSSSPLVTQYQTSGGSNYYNLHHLLSARFNVFRIQFNDRTAISYQDSYKVRL